MKILIIGKKNHLFWLENIYDGFNHIKCDVDFVATNKQGLYSDFTRNILKNIHKKSSSIYSSNKIFKKIEKYKPNLILVLSPFLLDEYISEMIGDLKNCFKIAWIGDRFGSHHKKVADNYDLLYFTDSYFVKEAKKFHFPNAKYLPLAVNENIFYNQNLAKKDNLLFIGNSTKERVDLFNGLDIKIKLIGNKWKKEINRSNIEILNKNISIYDVAKEYNKSKFILNIKHEKNVVNGLNMRTFEIPAVGSCLIQDYVKDLELNFDIYNELAIYKNVNEISELMKKLIVDKNDTKKMIKKAYLNVISNHLYKNRAQTILDEIS